jgi:hypothetical protein
MKTMLGIVSIASTVPAFAIENPENPDNAKKSPTHESAPKPATKVAWVGLGGAPVSEALAKHLGLQAGVGLTIHHVLEGAPAHNAGIRKHDVLTEFDGQQIGTFEALRDAVRSKNPGDEVEIVFIQEGKRHTKKAVLAERMVALNQGHIHPDPHNPLWRGMGGLPKADHQRMWEMMRQRHEELGKLLEEKGKIEFDLHDFIDGAHAQKPGNNKRIAPADANDRNFRFNAQASMTVMDDEGSVTIKVTNGIHEVIVKDKAGEVLFEGPYETPQDKAAVPDDYRGRIENIDFLAKMKNGFEFDAAPNGANQEKAE